MNRLISLRNSIVLGVTVLGLAATALPAQAQTDTGQRADPAKVAQFKARMAERHAERQARLHDSLKLSPAQEGAWTSYQNATQRQPRAGGAARGQWKDLPAPQRMARHIALSKQRLARMEAHQAALSQFYAALSPEQQKVLDEAGKHRGGGRHHGRHGQQRMHG